MKEISHRGSGYSPPNGSLDAIRWTGNTFPHGSKSKWWHFLTSASTVLVQPAGLCEDCSYSVSTNTSFLQNYVCAASLQAVAKIVYTFERKRNGVNDTKGKIDLDFSFVKYCFNHTIKCNFWNTYYLFKHCFCMLFPTLYMLQDNSLAKDVSLGYFSIPVSSIY